MSDFLLDAHALEGAHPAVAGSLFERVERGHAQLVVQTLDGLGADTLQPEQVEDRRRKVGEQLVAKRRVAGVGDFADAGGQVATDSRQGAESGLVEGRHRRRLGRDGLGGVAVRANLEWVVASNLEQVSDLEEQAGDSSVVHGVPGIIMAPTGGPSTPALHVARTPSPPDRTVAHGRVCRHEPHGGAPRAGARVLAGRRRLLRTQRRRARAGGRGLARDRDADQRSAALGERRSGRRPRRPVQARVHAVAADGDAGAQRRCRAGAAVRARAGRRAARRRHHPRFRARARHLHEPEEHGDRRPGARRARRRRRDARRGDHRGTAARRHWPRAENTSRATATRWPTRITTCRWSNTNPSGCAPSSSCRFARRLPPASPR